MASLILIKRANSYNYHNPKQVSIIETQSEYSINEHFGELNRNLRRTMALASSSIDLDVQIQGIN